VETVKWQLLSITTITDYYYSSSFSFFFFSPFFFFFLILSPNARNEERATAFSILRE